MDEKELKRPEETPKEEQTVISEINDADLEKVAGGATGVFCYTLPAFVCLKPK